MSLTIQAQSTIHNTFVIERTFPVTPERVFAALADPAKKQRWFLEGGGQQIEQFEMDFRVGGHERARLFYKKAGPFENVRFTNEGTYQDIVPGRRVVLASTMSMNGQHISAALVTFELQASEKGTDLVFTHQAAFFEGADGPQMRQEGWRKLFDQLADEVAHKA